MSHAFKMAVSSYLATAYIIVSALLYVRAMTIPRETLKKFSLTSCRRSNPELDSCVKEGLTKAIALFRGGAPLLGLPPLDPLEVPYLNVRHDESNLTLDLTLKKVSITGFADISIARVTMNLDDMKKVEVTGKTPALHVNGQYVSDGLIVNFPLHSSGAFSVNMTEVTSSWVIYLREKTVDKERYLLVDKLTIDMMPVSVSFRPADQLDGDNNLGEAVNIILNENSSEIYSIIKSKLASVLSDVVTEYANSVLRRVPEDIYLPP